MGTTRLMPWFSEFVRVRTGLLLLAAEAVFVFVDVGLIPAGRVLEVGRFLADDEVTGLTFSSVEEASPVFSLVVSQEAVLHLSSVDCSGTVSTSLFSLVEPFASSS